MIESTASIETLGLRDRDLRGEGLFVAEGRLLVERTVLAGYEVLSLFSSEDCAADARRIASARFEQSGRDIPVTVVSPRDIERVAGFPFHRGMLAVARRRNRETAEASGYRAFFGPDSPVASVGGILVLPSIVDPGNLGTLLRSALAFGYREIWVGKETCDPYNRKALRASMGAALSLDLREASASDLAELAHSVPGFPIYAAALGDGSLDVDDPETFSDLRKFRGAHALVLGNEYSGIPAEWATSCSASVQIPVSDEVDSLNVAVAGSVIMWEITRKWRFRRS